MKLPHPITQLRSLLVWSCSAAALLFCNSAQSQSTCSSDNQTPPTALLERFISADCAACWRDPATLAAAQNIAVLDWVVPGKLGEEAPLSVAASQAALERLEDQKLLIPSTLASHGQQVIGWKGAQLRVVQGPPVTGYLGAIVSLKLSTEVLSDAPLQAWLVMVESLPQGQEGSPVARNLVRNVLKLPWKLHNAPENKSPLTFFELRPLTIPEGALPARLRLIGWIENAQGQILSLSATHCPAQENQAN